MCVNRIVLISCEVDMPRLSARKMMNCGVHKNSVRLVHNINKIHYENHCDRWTLCLVMITIIQYFQWNFTKNCTNLSLSVSTVTQLESIVTQWIVNFLLESVNRNRFDFWNVKTLRFIKWLLTQIEWLSAPREVSLFFVFRNTETSLTKYSAVEKSSDLRFTRHFHQRSTSKWKKKHHKIQLLTHKSSSPHRQPWQARRWGRSRARSSPTSSWLYPTI